MKKCLREKNRVLRLVSYMVVGVGRFEEKTQVRNIALQHVLVIWF
jgi:hypothetical protein